MCFESVDSAEVARLAVASLSLPPGPNSGFPVGVDPQAPGFGATQWLLRNGFAPMPQQMPTGQSLWSHPSPIGVDSQDFTGALVRTPLDVPSIYVLDESGASPRLQRVGRVNDDGSLS